ncbi:FkbM family methyltransferase [Amycolatopsis sp. DG1A-15b]|uniref:FkbM family methyltransferase n=1 Tax=Amycolatopsis sp. DG1A-15b TaxID=3052846 RepID=UPI00255B62E8|nr:FkbM family methyltransferase [Amycolatopsis sp. DG1A-15b]WIX88192.1 FkbM family methyltransferase [Amycolatopsis sp. DG1A-15b]
MERLVPDVTGFDPALAGRMLATVACTDADVIPKVADAGTCRDHEGTRVQVMHNGLLVEEGGYYGAWMSEIIRALRGHHEPQEEIVFHRILERLAADGGTPAMIEFGSFWMYYGLWFCHAIPAGRVVGLEPDPAWIDVGRRNAALNGYDDRVRFVQGALGADPGEPVAFEAESDQRVRDVPQHDLASLLAETGLDRVDLVLADVQGAETVLLARARGDLEAGRVRFLVVSTHHHTISGDPLTHQNALRLLLDAGAHVIAEHTVGESVSGDGLIAVSFDPRDKDFTVPVTHARYRDSLGGELEYDLAAAMAARAEAEESAGTATRHAGRLGDEIGHLRAELARTAAERDQYQAELEAVFATKLWRWARKPREIYGRLTHRH